MNSKQSLIRRCVARLVRNLTAAYMTNERQLSTCLSLSVLQGIAAIKADVPWWGCGIVTLIWPVVAFLSNLLHPIPPNVERMHHYQLGRAAITGLRLKLRKVIESERLVGVVMARLVRFVVIFCKYLCQRRLP